MTWQERKVTATLIDVKTASKHVEKSDSMCIQQWNHDNCLVYNAMRNIDGSTKPVACQIQPVAQHIQQNKSTKQKQVIEQPQPAPASRQRTE